MSDATPEAQRIRPDENGDASVSPQAKELNEAFALLKEMRCSLEREENGNKQGDDVDSNGNKKLAVNGDNVSPETVAALKEEIAVLRKERAQLQRQALQAEQALELLRETNSQPKKKADDETREPSSDSASAADAKKAPAKWTALVSKVEECVSKGGKEGSHHKDPVSVWGPTDVKFTDEKIMANLCRQYQLTLVGIPIDRPSPTATAGSRVLRPGDRSTSTGAAQRNISPNASRRLPTPGEVSVNLRRTTPMRNGTLVSSTGSAANGSTPSKVGTTPMRRPTASPGATRTATPASAAKTRPGTTPLRRTTPSPGATSTRKAPPAATATPARSSSVSKRDGESDPSPKPVLRFSGNSSSSGPRGASGTPAKRDGSPPNAKRNAPSPARTGTSSTTAKPKSDGNTATANTHKDPTPPPAQDATEGEGNGVAPLAISAALAQFKSFAPDETPRVPGDGRDPPAATPPEKTQKKVRIAAPASTATKRTASGTGKFSRNAPATAAKR